MRLRGLLILGIACALTAVVAAPRSDILCLGQRVLHVADADYTGWSCLHYAAVRGDAHTVSRMLDYGGTVDQRTAGGRTALAVAADSGRLDVVQRLLAAGAETNAHDQTGATPLHLAAQAQQPGVARRLLAAGANPEARNRWQQTPLWLAAWQTWSGNTETAHVLVAGGADVDSADEKSNTPLHMAARAGHHAMIEFLLARGASLEAKNAQGRTPLYQAVIGNHPESVRALLRAGANPDVRVGKTGWTPLRAAFAEGNGDIAGLLAAHGARGYERYAAEACTEGYGPACESDL